MKASQFPKALLALAALAVGLSPQALHQARSYATLTLEVHLGLDIYQERQLFHGLCQLKCTAR